MSGMGLPMCTIRNCEAEVLRRGVLIVVGIDERGSNPQTCRPLPRVKGHVAKGGWALETRATVILRALPGLGVACGANFIT